MRLRALACVLLATRSAAAYERPLWAPLDGGAAHPGEELQETLFGTLQLDMSDLEDAASTSAGARRLQAGGDVCTVSDTKYALEGAPALTGTLGAITHPFTWAYGTSGL